MASSKMADGPLHKKLVSPMNNQSNRAMVEKYLQTYGRGDTVTIMAHTGLSEGKVRTALNGLQKQGRAHCDQSRQRNILWYPGPRKIISTAQPRMEIPRDTYKPEQWPVEYSRPGALDHLQYGSRRGDDIVPHRGPIHGCVGVLADNRPLFRN